MYTPYPHQNDAVDSIFAYYAKGSTGNPVVAMPTATGKSLVIGEFVKRVLQRWPRQRILCATHVKELIVQNAEKLRSQWPEAPLGIFSAGLGMRETNFPVVYGGIRSIVNNIAALGWRDLMLVDEAHLIGHQDDSEYLTLIKGLRAVNPRMKVIGFTATPYRLGRGLISDGPIFSDICFNLCDFKAFNKLIAEGYLVAPVPKRMHTTLDTSSVKVTGGEFNQGDLQKAVDKDSVTVSACREIIEEGFDRKCWLLFASGIEHAEHIANMLSHFGIDVTTIHSRIATNECDKRYRDWKEGHYLAMVNYGKLTTGVDHPPIDLIAVLRPTMSTSLWVQMLGRGTRPSPATLKENCLVLDFARNTERLGPINDPVIPRKRVKGQQPGVAPVRICPHCGVYNHARSTECFACGCVFPKNEKLFREAGTAELLRTEELATIEAFDVQRVVYNRHQKQGRPPVIKVSYFCTGGLRMFSEYVGFDNTGFALTKAHDWWRNRTKQAKYPPSTDEALKWVSLLPWPKRIKVQVNKKYPEVLGYEY